MSDHQAKQTEKNDITSTCCSRASALTRTEWASDKDGSFKRQQSGFRDVVSPASDANAKFPAEKGRYVLYVCMSRALPTTILMPSISLRVSLVRQPSYG